MACAERRVRSLNELRMSPSSVINVSNNEIESLSGLPRPEIIKNLQASNNCLSKIEEGPLQFCQSLMYLDLSYNSITKIENLFYLTHLHSLNLSHNRIVVVENLEGLVNLRQLNLSDNGAHSIFVRSPLPKLVVVDLSGNKFKKLIGLNAFPCMSTLKIDRCELTALTGLQKQLNLRRISASNNEIVNFQPFYLPLLSHIDITMNRITSLSGFSRFQSLVRLDISGNPLDDNGLGINCVFPELKEFRADGSQISDPSLIGSIAPNVVVVSLAFCKISSAGNVRLMIATAKELLCLDLRGNPLNSGCYPDVDGLTYGDKLKEYESEDQYDSAYPETAGARANYRRSILAKINCKLVWLDGVGVPGKGAKSMPSPSKMNFQFVEEVQDDMPSEEAPNEVFDEQSVQCDLSCSTFSDVPLFVDQGLQTERHPKQQVFPPNYQYPPTRKIWATDSSEIDAKNDLRKYVQLTDDEDLKSPPKARRHSNESSASFASGDAGRLDGDLQKMGIGRCSHSDSGAFEDIYDDLDKCSAATDLDSEIFHVFESPHPMKAGNGARPNQRFVNANEDDDEMVRNKGGVSFWVSVPVENDLKRRRSNNTPPFGDSPHIRPGANVGHWPFNSKSARRLPWDHEKIPPPDPVWKRKKTVKEKPVRRPRRQPNRRAASAKK